MTAPDNREPSMPSIEERLAFVEGRQHDHFAAVDDLRSTVRELRTDTNREFPEFRAEVSREYEWLPAPFVISPGVIVPAGGYTYSTTRVSYGMGQQRKVSGRISMAGGTLYDGTKLEVSYSGRWGVVPQFSIEPSIALNWVSLPAGDFTARLVSSRFTITPSARMSISSLVQYNVVSHYLSSSARLRWEYTGGSEVFVVYSDGRGTATTGLPLLQNRTVAIKVTRLVRF